MVNGMVNLYAALIIQHRRTIDKIPEKLQEAVKERLAELGYDSTGEINN